MKTTLAYLSGFYRPDSGCLLYNSEGQHLGYFDFNWSEDLLFRLPNGETLRSPDWLGLLALLFARFGSE